MMVFQYEKCRAESRRRAGKKPGEYSYRYGGEDASKNRRPKGSPVGGRARTRRGRRRARQPQATGFASFISPLNWTEGGLKWMGFCRRCISFTTGYTLFAPCSISQDGEAGKLAVRRLPATIRNQLVDCNLAVE